MKRPRDRKERRSNYLKINGRLVKCQNSNITTINIDHTLSIWLEMEFTKDIFFENISLH